MMSLRPLSLLTLALALLPGGCDKTDSHAGDPQTGVNASASAAPAPAANPVQHEMRVLHEATRDWVTAVANHNLPAIPASIPEIHRARAATEAALEKGTYRPPKNGDRLDAFKKQDEEFHDSLVELLTAAKANDLPRTTEQLGNVLRGCTSCHVEYRF